jgi:hypothetical protein
MSQLMPAIAFIIYIFMPFSNDVDNRLAFFRVLAEIRQLLSSYFHCRAARILFDAIGFQITPFFADAIFFILITILPATLLVEPLAFACCRRRPLLRSSAFSALIPRTPIRHDDCRFSFAIFD